MLKRARHLPWLVGVTAWLVLIIVFQLRICLVVVILRLNHVVVILLLQIQLCLILNLQGRGRLNKRINIRCFIELCRFNQMWILADFPSEV